MAAAICIVFFALRLPYLGNFGRYGDFSYGIYIIHFPVVQLMVSWGAFERHPWLAAVLTLAAILALAYLCWHWVEKPFLMKSSHYVRATSGLTLGEGSPSVDGDHSPVAIEFSDTRQPTFSKSLF